jgi:hypothetical protein
LWMHFVACFALWSGGGGGWRNFKRPRTVVMI